MKSRPTFDSIGIVSYRQLLEKSARAFKQDKNITIKPFSIGNIKAEWIIPPEHAENRIILYTHGGGFIAGSINSHRDLASRIARSARAKLLIYNYRLAPEQPFPKGFEDAVSVYCWLIEQFDKSAKIVLAGDSAGAGLTLSLLLHLLETDQRLPDCITMLSPWVDLECEKNSHKQNHDKDFMLSQSLLKKTARLYTDQDLASPMISPINGDFKKMPPVLIQTGGNEILLNDSKRLEKRLKQAKVNVSLEIWDEMFHVWHYFARYLPEGRDAISHIGDFIQSHT